MTASTISSLTVSRSNGLGTTMGSTSVISTERVGEGGGVWSEGWLEGRVADVCCFFAIELGRGLCESVSFVALRFLLLGICARGLLLSGVAAEAARIDGEAATEEEAVRRCPLPLPGKAIPRLGKLNETFLVLYAGILGGRVDDSSEGIGVAAESH